VLKHLDLKIKGKLINIDQN